MFDFLKPEKSGMKNVLNGYFAFKNTYGIVGNVPIDRMPEMAEYYYNVRLGPPLVSGARSHQMQSAALSTLGAHARQNGGKVTIIGILFGLLAAEGMTNHIINSRVVLKVFDDFPSIPPEIRGI